MKWEPLIVGNISNRGSKSCGNFDHSFLNNSISCMAFSATDCVVRSAKYIILIYFLRAVLYCFRQEYARASEYIIVCSTHLRE